MLTLKKIETCGDKKRPMRVHFTAGGESYTLDCTGGEVQSFSRFQAAALERCGVLVRHSAELDREGKTSWLNAVERATKVGRRSDG